MRLCSFPSEISLCSASSDGFLGPGRFRIGKIEEKSGSNELLSLVLLNSFSS